MFNNQIFSKGKEDEYELKVFNNIRKSKLYNLVTHAMVFSCVEAISWIVQHVDLETRYILNSRDYPIESFHPSYIASYYHLDKGEISLDKNLIKEFPLKVKDLFKFWYKSIKLFKSRPSEKYLINLLSIPY